MIKPTKIALGLLFALSNITAQADNLLDIYNLAKDNDPTLLASEAGTLATGERVNQSFSILLPQISATYSLSHGEDESSRTSFNNDLVGPPRDTGSNGSNDTTGGNIRLTQEVYNHGSWIGLEQAEKRALQSKVNHEGTKQNLIIRVAETYFNVLAALDSLEFSKAETKSVSQELEQTNQRYKVGLIAVTDVNEAQARYDTAVANQISAQNALDNSHELLQQITGQYHYQLLGLMPEIDLAKPQPEIIEDWVKQAETNNIDLKAAQIGMEIAKKGISLKQAGHFPSVSLSANYSDSSSDWSSAGSEIVLNSIDSSDFYGDSSRNQSSISLDFNIPLYSGGRTSSEVKEAQSLYLQAAHSMEANRRVAVSSTRSAYLGVVAAVSSVKALKQAVKSSQSALEAIQAGFEVGTRTIVDVLIQTRLLYDAKRQYARARYDYVLNTLKLKQAVGLLTINDLAKVNQLLR